jgi:ketosteroid isomerase-like protein
MVILPWIIRRKVRATFIHFNQHDVKNFLKAWNENGVFIYPGTSSLAGRFEGKKAVEEWFRTYMDYFPKINFTIKNIFVKSVFGVFSNVTGVEWDVAITNKKGENYNYSGVTVIHMDKLKVVLVKDYFFDPEVVKKALGE